MFDYLRLPLEIQLNVLRLFNSKDVLNLVKSHSYYEQFCCLYYDDTPVCEEFKSLKRIKKVFVNCKISNTKQLEFPINLIHLNQLNLRLYLRSNLCFCYHSVVLVKTNDLNFTGSDHLQLQEIPNNYVLILKDLKDVYLNSISTDSLIIDNIESLVLEERLHVSESPLELCGVQKLSFQLNKDNIGALEHIVSGDCCPMELVLLSSHQFIDEIVNRIFTPIFSSNLTSNIHTLKLGFFAGLITLKDLSFLNLKTLFLGFSDSFLESSNLDLDNIWLIHNLKAHQLENLTLGLYQNIPISPLTLIRGLDFGESLYSLEISESISLLPKDIDRAGQLYHTSVNIEQHLGRISATTIKNFKKFEYSGPIRIVGYFRNLH